MKTLTFAGQVVLTVLCFAVLIALYAMVIDYAPVRVERASWLSKEESIRLQNLHGVHVLRVSDNVAEIFRDGEWIQVFTKGEKR